MKNLISHPLRLSIIGSIVCISSALAIDTNSAPADDAPQTPVVTPAPSAPVASVAVQTDSAKLPYGTADVVKLSRSQVSEDVIVSYVQNSGIAYSLAPDDIVRLRSEGVTDRVINTMLAQHTKAVQAAQVTASVQATAPAPAYNDGSGNSGTSETQAVPNSQTAVEAPLTPPASSTYVIPYPPATSAYYGYPYYPYYYGGYYGGPIVSFGFGFRGHYGGHGYYGGHGHHGGHHR